GGGALGLLTGLGGVLHPPVPHLVELLQLGPFGLEPIGEPRGPLGLLLVLAVVVAPLGGGSGFGAAEGGVATEVVADLARALPPGGDMRGLPRLLAFPRGSHLAELGVVGGVVVACVVGHAERGVRLGPHEPGDWRLPRWCRADRDLVLGDRELLTIRGNCSRTVDPSGPFGLLLGHLAEMLDCPCGLVGGGELAEVARTRVDPAREFGLELAERPRGLPGSLSPR